MPMRKSRHAKAGRREYGEIVRRFAGREEARGRRDVIPPSSGERSRQQLVEAIRLRLAEAAQ